MINFSDLDLDLIVACVSIIFWSAVLISKIGGEKDEND